ncbi:mitochondrial acidic protein mam33 [Mercurialis annua]|uniref:mitochondrial acidic protein mam33 n=1 Tax=Mercurialis annua TaxID=3986 RepID=UPI00215F8CD0|nr:mitochondrial acidic protein mam33 [Mercurialis annua]
MPRPTQILRHTRKALEDSQLLKVLQSEIKHEQSSPPLQGYYESGYLGDFVVDYDSSKSQDVVLRRKCESGEEVAVSALVGPKSIAEDGSFRGGVLMKVCVKKPGLNSMLQLDCGVTEKLMGGSQFDILSAHYIKSANSHRKSEYRGPLFSTLDPNLQDALKEYLVAKGISESLTNFLLLHLNQKEQGQYLKWLQKLESLLK